MRLKNCKSIFLSSIVFILAGKASSSLTPAPVLGKPDVLIISADMPAALQATQTATAQGFYEFWNTNDPKTLSNVVSPNFMDRDLPAGRPQGPGGPLFANTQFRKAVPDLHCEVTQQIIVGDRVVSNLRFTGHFTGTFGTKQGSGQTVDFVATDILRIQSGKITDNWHLEDNLTFQQQIGVVKR